MVILELSLPYYFLHTVSADITLSHYTQNLVVTLLYSRVASLTDLCLYHIYAANN